MKLLPAYAFLIAGLAVGIPSAMATTTSSNEGSKKTTAKKASAAKKEAEAHIDDDDQPDIKGLKATAFDCELGNKITIYTDTADDQQIALQWNKRTHRLLRVSTTTGAHRFENAKSGLVWIGIPAKGMLLDAKKGKQLANECKSLEQATQKATTES